LPGPEWAEELLPATPPMAAEWTKTHGEVRHTFTHFHLRLKVFVSRVPSCDATPPMSFETPEPKTLPTVFKKALIHGLSALESL